MADKQLTQNEIIKLAAEAGAQAGIERYQTEVAKQRRVRTDTRLRNTERLMRHYHEIRLNAENAISTFQEAQTEDFDFFKAIMEDGEARIDVKAIMTAKARSAVMVTHIDTMLGILAQVSLNSKDPSDVRKFRVFEARYILDPPYTVHEIAEREAIDVRTVYRDSGEMCDKLSSLLFGVQVVNEDNM